MTTQPEMKTRKQILEKMHGLIKQLQDGSLAQHDADEDKLVLMTMASVKSLAWAVGMEVEASVTSDEKMELVISREGTDDIAAGN